MPGTLLSAEFPVTPCFGPAQVLLDRAERWFRRPRQVIAHTLRLGSRRSLLDQIPQGKQTRLVPSAWGTRRDDYRWRGGRGSGDCAALRHGAGAMGWALAHAPLPCWQALTPGGMGEVMGKTSSLYQPDYWLLTLHYLVWSGRLPYPIKARWVRGSSIHDECFEFVSELPVGLAEASMDALILFREAAAAPASVIANVFGPAVDEGPMRRIAVEPPVCCEGQWSMTPSRRALSAQSKEPEAQTQSQPAMSGATGDPALQNLPRSAQSQTGDDGVLRLDDQTFTIRCGGAVYRFAARNKQLFALLERINRRPDHRVSFDDLRSSGDVWDGLNVEDSTIRGAVARLRKLLKQHAMDPLAARIITGTYQGSRYVLIRAADE